MPEVRELAEALCDALAAVRAGRVHGRRLRGADRAAVPHGEQLSGGRRAGGDESLECGAYRDRGFTNPVDWLARTAGSSARAACAALGTVAAVKDCPATRDALSPGRCRWRRRPRSPRYPRTRPSYSRSRCGRAWGALREEARTRWLAAIPPDTLHAAAEKPGSSSHWKNRLGMTCFRGALPPEVGVPFAKRMDAETDRAWRAACRDGREATRVQCAADAFGSSSTVGASARDGRSTW